MEVEEKITTADTDNQRIKVVEQFLIAQLKDIKTQIKHMEAAEEQIEVQVRNLMGEYQEIRGVDGTTLVSWKSAKNSKRFNSSLFQSAMPDIYDQFVMDTPGSRRFLVK